MAAKPGSRLHPASGPLAGYSSGNLSEMSPYLEPPELKLGPFTLHAFGFLVFIAVLVGRLMMNRRSRQQGLDRSTAARLWLWVVVGGFVGAHLTKVLAENPGGALHSWEWLPTRPRNLAASCSMLPSSSRCW